MHNADPDGARTGTLPELNHNPCILESRTATNLWGLPYVADSQGFRQACALGLTIITMQVVPLLSAESRDRKAAMWYVASYPAKSTRSRVLGHKMISCSIREHGFCAKVGTPCELGFWEPCDAVT